MSGLVKACSLPPRFTIATTWHHEIDCRVYQRGERFVVQGLGMPEISLTSDQRVRVLRVLP